MSRISYVNGRYLPHAYAMVSVEDRGLQFADGVYEVVEYFNRRPVDLDLHLARLWRSLKEIAITAPMSEAAMRRVVRELLRRNSRRHGLLYIQVNRGAGLRDHAFPKKPISPSVMMTVMPPRVPTLAVYEKGVAAVTREDTRWARRDIKSVALLPNVLAKQEAVKEGVREVIFTGPGDVVYEGSSTNIYMVDDKGVLWTHPADSRVLPGTIRIRALEMARDLQIKVKEEPFTRKAMMAASEVFLSSCSSHILPVVTIDGQTIGSGKPGKVARALLHSYHQLVQDQTHYLCPTPK